MANTQAPEQPEHPAGILPMFYTNPEPLNPQKHGKLGLRRDFNYGFARGVNAVPLNIAEIPQACHFFPIAFGAGESPMPIALLGLRDKENLFVDEQGNWLRDTYIPAYVRRYPFVFSEVPGGEQLTLCVDVTESTVEEREEGGRFFTEDGSPSELARNALEFCKNFQQAAQQTAPFSRAIVESGLLAERQLAINLDQDRRITFGGFRAVDEQKLAEMADEQFLEWRRQNWLPVVYAHMISASQFDRLAAMLRRRLAAEEGAQPEPSTPTAGAPTPAPDAPSSLADAPPPAND